jgi:predicted DNA-binding transcriptional regulator AlpA
MTPWGRLLPPKEARKIWGVSQSTEWRMGRDGNGPPRIQISANRYAYPEKEFYVWLASRFEKPINLQPAE